ncbi:MAG: polysaccharide (de)acetylase [Flavobacterium sp. JAD_PAG50586_2]|nr:MAG: polysaccharide (de)acetylase [Flavobacterium sp. JAD_PAG50586_2]
MLVFESDDWGSIRIPDKKAFALLLNQGLIKPNDPFSKYDALENAEDLIALFSVLKKFKDSQGNHPVFTANMVMANPDFEKIKTADYIEYYWEQFTKTYERFSKDTFLHLQKGIEEKLFFPQYHAREHLNVQLWMELLQKGDASFRKAFDLNCFAIPYQSKDNRRDNLMASYDYNSDADFRFIQKSITEGLFIFESVFNQKSETTIAPCYVWDEAIEDAFKKNGISVFQGSRFQNIPKRNGGGFKTAFHFNGQRKNESLYLSRNGLFEPSLSENIDWVSKCMESISIAFKWNKPAVIGTHRLNFIGSLVEENRRGNLEKLELLLTKITQKWPEVEFVNSADLVNVYINYNPNK